MTSVRARGLALASISVSLLAACAGAPTTSPIAQVRPLDDAPFEVSGRLSARRGSEGAAAGFRWTHRPQSDELVLSTPLGAALARIEGDANEVRLSLADGRTATARDWEALTTRVVGAPIPVRGLAWWIRGSPHPGSAHAAERDARARLVTLSQDGWDIVVEYANDDARPSRLRLTYPDTEVRVVLDAWHDAP